jgi:hypothetical protein
MELSTAWAKYVSRLSAIDKTATKELGELVGRISNFSFSNPEHMALLVTEAYTISTEYGEAAAALAAEMYDAVGLASGMFLDYAEVAETASIAQVDWTVRGAAKTQNMNEVTSAVGRLVKKAGIDTVLKNAKRDGAEVAWVPNGDTCAYCIALAARGWRDADNSYQEHIHSNCDCTLATRFNGNTSIKGYDPRKYEDMYYGADLDGRKATAKNRVNALRREFYAKNKEEINAQKRINYAERKERLNSSEAEEIDVN